MLHHRWISRFKEDRHSRWVGISPFQASTFLDPAFKQGSHRLAPPSARSAIAKRAFRSLHQPGVPSQGAPERSSAEQAVSAQGCIRKIDWTIQCENHSPSRCATFECGRRAHLASDQGTGAQGDVIILMALSLSFEYWLGHVLGVLAVQWESSDFDKKPGACGACAVLMGCCLLPRGQGQGLIQPTKQTPFRAFSPSASAGA